MNKLMLLTIMFGIKTNTPIQDMVGKIRLFGQSSVLINTGSKTIMIDPFNVPEDIRADLVLITHDHFDHLSEKDLRLVVTPNTKVIAPASCMAKVSAVVEQEVMLVEPGQLLSIDGVGVDVVPAYNIDKTEFHPRANHWVGYVLKINGVKIYHPGDTERIPEMKNIRCDIVLMPLGQTYTMNSVEDAAETVKDVCASVAIPMHYGLYEGTEQDARRFSELLAGTVEVVIKL